MFYWVYIITNLVNGKIYIGKHTGRDLNKYLHLNLSRAHGTKRQNDKPLLYRAMRKYGYAAFAIHPLVCLIDQDQANQLERFFIRTMDARNTEVGYNIAFGGFGGESNIGRKHRAESIEKMRAAQLGKEKSPDHCKNLSIAKTGKPCPHVAVANAARRSENPTPAAIRNRLYRERKKLRAAGIEVRIVHPWLGRKHSEETKAKMSASGKGLKKPRKKNKEACHSSNKTEIRTPFSTLPNLPARENLNLLQPI